ncbi:hypothetical protein TNCV_893831 [Trichonephila clavipes]|nr:hypothetical protein TNCV_893831 [Trichonephila clavipes]
MSTLNDYPKLSQALKSSSTNNIKILHRLIFGENSDRKNHSRLIYTTELESCCGLLTAVLHKELESNDSSVLYLVLKLAWCCYLVIDGGRGFRRSPMGWKMAGQENRVNQ